MENLADALRMAAGVMLAVLLISLMVYIFQTATNFEEEKSQRILIEQVNEFNKKFAAYEKSSMYGTDVMSVISLAINNNRDLNAARSLHPHGNYKENLDGSVNIKVDIAQDKIQKKTYKIVIDNAIPVGETGHETKTLVSSSHYFSGSDYHNGYLDLYQVSTCEKFENMITENNIIVTKQTTTDHGLKITITQEDNIGLESFKTTIFTCSDTKHSQTGKVYEMTFKAISN